MSNKQMMEVVKKTGKNAKSSKDFDLYVNGNRKSQDTVSRDLIYGHLNAMLNKAITEFKESEKRVDQYKEIKAEHKAPEKKEVTKKEYLSNLTDYAISWTIRINKDLEFQLLDGEEGPESDFVVNSDMAKTHDEQYSVFTIAQELLGGCNALRNKVAKFIAQKTPGPYTVGQLGSSDDNIYEYVNGQLVKVNKAFLDTDKVIQTLLNITKTDKMMAMQNDKSIGRLNLIGGHLKGVTLVMDDGNFKVIGLEKTSPIAQAVVKQFLKYFEVTQMGIATTEMIIKVNETSK